VKVVPVPLGSRGADMAAALTFTNAADLKTAGLDYVTRYVGGISGAELALIHAAGLGLQLVTYSRAPGWTPSAALGAGDGAGDVAHLHALGIPAGMLVWIDLEGVSGSAADVIAWVEARAAALVGAGYIAGLYVGAGEVLNAAQLYALRGVTRYWRAFNQGIPEPRCGWCQFQTFPPNQTLHGVEIDRDFVQSDYEGRTPLMLVA
jgi:hypothetical protein